MDSDRNAPATKGDMEDLGSELRAEMKDLRSELRAEMKDLRSELRAEMKALEDRLVEAMRDMQTEMLKAFYSFAQPTAERLTSNEAETASLKKRLGMMETRILEVERRLNMPPQPE